MRAEGILGLRLVVVLHATGQVFSRGHSMVSDLACISMNGLFGHMVSEYVLMWCITTLCKLSCSDSMSTLVNVSARYYHTQHLPKNMTEAVITLVRTL